MPETRVTRRMPPPVDPALFADVAQLQVDVSAAQSTADDAQAEASANRPNTSTFSEDGTWNKPGSATWIEVVCVGSNGEPREHMSFHQSELAASVAVTVATGSGGLHTTSFGTHVVAVGTAGAAGACYVRSSV